jgi:hypothetical protein
VWVKVTLQIKNSSLGRHPILEEQNASKDDPRNPIPKNVEELPCPVLVRVCAPELDELALPTNHEGHRLRVGVHKYSKTLRSTWPLPRTL